MRKYSKSITYDQLCMIFLLITVITPPLDFFGFKLNYFSSVIFSITLVSCILLDKIRLTPFELIYLLLFFTCISVLFASSSKDPAVAILYCTHLLGVFLIPVILRRNVKAQGFLFNGILWYTCFNCVCVILFNFYKPHFLPVWVTNNGYAFLYQPYLFAVFVGFSMIYVVKKNIMSAIILFVPLLYFLLHSNSRIIALVFIILLLFISRFRMKLVLLFTSIALSVVAPPLKLLTILTPSVDFDFIITDGSFAMRMTMFDNFLEWLDWKRFLFGGGYRAFEEFSFPYGMPGPTDVLYVRMISEIGIVGMVIILFGFFYLASRNYASPMNFTVVTLIILLLGLAQESWYTASAGHLISIIYLGLGSLIHAPPSQAGRGRV